MKHIDEHYKDWCGESHINNACHSVHDSAEAIDFAEYYHKEMLGIKRDNSPRYFIIYYKASIKIRNGIKTGRASIKVSNTEGNFSFINSKNVVKHLEEINPDGKDFVMTGFNEISEAEYEIWNED